MEKIDQLIIKTLRKNPTKSFLKIAKEVGISTNTVKKRFQKMLKENIILGSSLLLDVSKIGYQGKIFLFIKNSKKYDSSTVLKNLSNIPNVFIIIELLGTYDLLIMAIFRSLNDAMKIVNEVRSNPGVRCVDITITEDTMISYKEEYDEVQLF